jgi:hypothetical protein
MINKKNISINDFINTSTIIPSTWSGFEQERKLHLDHVLTQPFIDGDVLEFGVYEGKTITQIANFLTDKKIWGFDSFEGLPEDWFLLENSNDTKFPKGTFKLNNIPKVPDNVTLIKGWFNDTIPAWKQNNHNFISMLHIDCDLYSSTKEVLFQLNSQIVTGSVIVFDDLYIWNDPDRYQLWHQGEYRALKEWVEAFDREFDLISRNNYMQCAIRVSK